MRKWMTIALSLVLAVTALAGCGGSGSGSEGDDKHLVMFTIPTHASDEYRNQMEKLGELLSMETGYEVEVRIPTDYAAVVEAMRFGKADLAYFGPFSYVVANAQSGAQAFVTLNINGRPYYHSYAIVHKDSPIGELSDEDLATLKGRTIALGDPSSTSGSMIPQLALQNAGLNPKKDVKLIFTGAHDATLKTVAAQKADIGFLDSAIFEGSLSRKFPEDYANVRVVWKSMELYQYPIAHRKDMDSELVAKLKQAFLKIDDPYVLEAFGADSFVEADDAKYDPIRDAAAALGIDLAQYELE